MNQLQVVNRRIIEKRYATYEIMLPALIFSSSCSPENPLRTCAPQLRTLALFIRNSSALQFRTLVDISVVDRMRPHGRFAITYHFLSTTFNQRIAIQLFASEVSVVPSLATFFVNKQQLFASAGWLEREAWDMYGCYFAENGDLRRLLTDYGFSGFPLRKDFPLTGFHEVAYSETEGRVIHRAINMPQEYRAFHL